MDVGLCGEAAGERNDYELAARTRAKVTLCRPMDHRVCGGGWTLVIFGAQTIAIPITRVGQRQAMVINNNRLRPAMIIPPIGSVGN